MIETFEKHLRESLKNKKFKRLYEEEVKKLDLMLKIHEEREKKGMSQADVAKEAHITQQQMSKIENGENCTLSTLLKVCQALGLELVIQKSSPQSYIGVAEEKAEYNKK